MVSSLNGYLFSLFRSAAAHTSEDPFYRIILYIYIHILCYYMYYYYGSGRNKIKCVLAILSYFFFHLCFHRSLGFNSKHTCWVRVYTIYLYHTGFYDRSGGGTRPVAVLRIWFFFIFFSNSRTISSTRDLYPYNNNINIPCVYMADYHV